MCNVLRAGGFTSNSPPLTPTHLLSPVRRPDISPAKHLQIPFFPLTGSSNSLSYVRTFDIISDNDTLGKIS